jgi:hypothetical protein
MNDIINNMICKRSNTGIGGSNRNGLNAMLIAKSFMTEAMRIFINCKTLRGEFNLLVVYNKMFKMKKKFFMAVSAVSIILTSCSQSEPISVIDVEPISSELATLKINLSGAPATRAISDANANPDELKATSATIFVFSAQNSYQADTTVNLSNHSTQSGYEVTFHVPTGNGKRIYVGMNFSQALQDSVRLNGLAAMTYPIVDQENLFYASGTGNTPNFNGNLMFNDKPVIVDIAPGHNVASVAVERMASKITVKREGELQNNSTVTASNATFLTPTFKFAMANKNIKILPMKEQSKMIDANWKSDSVEVYKNDFQNEFAIHKMTYPTQWDTTRYVPVDDNNTSINNRQTKYALENTHEMPRPGEVTYVSLKVKFVPQFIATAFDDTTKRPVTVPVGSVPANMDTLHVVIDNNTYYYYTDRAIAAEHIGYMRQFMADADYSTYYGQNCFYNVFLNSDPTGKDYQANRNEYYDVGISKISKLGRPYPELDKEEMNNIIGATSSITVSITVNQWTMVDMGGQVLGN